MTTPIDPDSFRAELEQRLDRLMQAFRVLHRQAGQEAGDGFKTFFADLFALQTWFHRTQPGPAVTDREPHFELLYKSSLVLNASLDLPELLELALDTVLAMCGAGRGFIARVESDGSFSFFAARNFEKQTIPQPEQEISRSVVERALQLKAEVRIQAEDLDNSLLEKTSLLRREGRALICVPLPIDGLIRGVIYLDRFQSALTHSVFAMVRAFAAQLTGFMKNAQAFAALRADRAELLADLKQRYRFESIICKSKAMLHILQTTAKVASTDAQILIMGETGTGKDLIARAVHENSPRRNGPYIEVDCGALPGNLIESELFGHARGAFTGAIEDRMGLLEAAKGGSLFLDEINNLPRESQTRLLRALQQRKIRRIGETRERPVDFRLIAASSRGLAEMVAAETFRQDLYYRINTVALTLPPLRERKDDLVLLLTHFLERFATSYQRPILTLSPRALSALENHNWPGNVRELEHVVERAVILCEGDRLRLADLPMELSGSEPWEADEAELSLEDYLNRARKYYIAKVLHEHGGKKVDAAKQLGINRSYLFQLIKQLGI